MIIDGGNRTLPEHASFLAEHLKLTPEQASILVAELQNALVPVQTRLGTHPGLDRIFALCQAIQNRAIK